MSGTAAVGNTFASAVTATGLQLDNNFSTVVAYLNDPTNRNNYAADAGTTNTIVTTFAPPVVGGYTAGLEITFKAAAANSGGVVVNANGLGNKNLFKKVSNATAAAALTGGEIQAGDIVKAVYDGTQFQMTSPWTFKAPSIATITTTGTATYTVSAGAAWIDVQVWGAGGGGAGSGTTPGAAAAGGTSSFSVCIAGGGAAGSTTNGATGSGGTATGGDINITGSSGGLASAIANSPGGYGGNSPMLGGGAPLSNVGNNPGSDAVQNTGAGGGGAGCGATTNSGSGGGAGSYSRKIFTTPASSYVYAVGAGGAGGSAGGSGQAGGAGAAGRIIITTHYQ